MDTHTTELSLFLSLFNGHSLCQYLPNLLIFRRFLYLGRLLRKGSLKQYSLSCCMFLTVYLWPLYFKVSLAGYKICGSYFLSLNILNVLLHCLLAPCTILQKSPLFFPPLQVILSFCLSAYFFLFL